MPTIMEIGEVQGLLTILPESTACRAEGIAFFALALGTLALCALQGRTGSPAGPGTWVLAAGAIAMPFRFYRLLPYAGMILAGVALKGLGALARGRPDGAAAETRPVWRRALAAGVCVLVLAPAVWYAARDPRFQFGLGVAPRMFPEGAARFIQRADVRGPIYNDINFGHYLLWSLFPRHKVFIHLGFWNSVADDRLVARYSDSARDPAIFEALVREYGVELLVLPNRQAKWRFSGMPWPFVAADPRWALVYWDEMASVYARRDGANTWLIAAHEFRATHFAEDLSYLDGLAHDPEAFRAAAAELRRAVSEDRVNVWALFSLAVLLKARGRDLEEALEALEVAQGHGILDATVLGWKAEILARLGRAKAAEAAAREALRMDPANAIARFVLADLRARADDGENAGRVHTDGLDRPWVIGP
jgi:tetratricopeptide (TPR) repeat protein